MFPSPCGDYGSYRSKGRIEYFPTVWKFPSPCGDYGSYQLCGRNGLSRLASRFRPLAGIMVLIRKGDAYNEKDFRRSFRPLAGIMVLI